MNKNILITVIMGIIILVNGCSAEQVQTSDRGFLEGEIAIGPICPVERVPPDPSCQPTQETYDAWPVAVYTEGTKEKVEQIKPLIDGSYALELPVGDYVIDLEKQHMFGANLPANINIKKGETTTLNIEIDTGIR